MASLEHIRLENGALLDRPVLPVRIYGTCVLHRDGSRAVAVQTPGVPKQSSIGMNEARWGTLVVRSVVVEVSTESGHLETSNRDCANFFRLPCLPIEGEA